MSEEVAARVQLLAPQKGMVNTLVGVNEHS